MNYAHRLTVIARGMDRRGALAVTGTGMGLRRAWPLPPLPTAAAGIAGTPFFAFHFPP